MPRQTSPRRPGAVAPAHRACFALLAWFFNLRGARGTFGRRLGHAEQDSPGDRLQANGDVARPVLRLDQFIVVVESVDDARISIVKLPRTQ
jgi:hypothetical protein